MDIFSKKLWEKEQTQVRELKGEWFQKSEETPKMAVNVQESPGLGALCFREVGYQNH